MIYHTRETIRGLTKDAGLWLEIKSPGDGMSRFRFTRDDNFGVERQIFVAKGALAAWHFLQGYRSAQIAAMWTR